MKKKYTFIILIVFVFSLISCKNNEPKVPEKNFIAKQHKADDAVKHWSYEGETSPEHWAEIEKHSNCAGKKQSPINIIDIDSKYVSKDSLNLKVYCYTQTIIHDVVNNGHSVQFDFELGDSIIVKNETFHLKQIHFHEPSEHTIDGIRYPIEIHLVHANKKGEYTVLGILGKEGKEHEDFEFLEMFLPVKNGETKAIDKPFDLKTIFPANIDDYYSYKGSLTTPPCSETVDWVVFKNPIVLSVNQVLKLKKNMPLNNYRNEQPINDREVIKTFN